MKNNKKHNITPDKCRHPSGAFFLCIIFVLGLAGICHAATTSGVLLEDENWSENMLITGTVMVPDNITLSIQPGTTVKFVAGENIELIVKGQLIAEGTDLNPITFTSNAANPTKWDWTWIRLEGGASSGSSFKYCVIEYANTGIRIKDSSPVIENNVFSNNCYGINVSSSSSLIKKNVFYNNDYGISTDRCDSIIAGNKFYNNAQDAINLSNHSSSTIDHNLIYSNGGCGIQIEGLSEPVIINNTINGNVLDAIHIKHALAQITIKNNILSANERDGISTYDSSLPTILYNDTWNNASHNYYDYTSGNTFVPDPSTGEISKDPLFNDVENEDYTLQTCSPCIDAGDPADNYSSEPEPNGDRINMGTYGGTSEATTSLIDSDNDGLTDYLENAGCTDPFDADSDDDGIPDGVEDANHNGAVDEGETDPCNVDTDGDGIQDGTELGITEPVTDPDGEAPLLGTDTAVFIPDAEPNTTTNPLNADSDGDGAWDGAEDANHDGRVDAGETDPNNALSYPTAIIHLKPGFNLIAIPADVSTQPDLKDWLPVLGNSSEIEKVMVYDEANNRFITLIPEDGSNPSFTLNGGDGLIVYAKGKKQIGFTTVNCSNLDLELGFNLIGIACPADGYTAFDLLSSLGSENVSSIQRYSTDKGAFETAGFGPDSQHAGVDFPIISGEGYFIFMKQEVFGF